MQVLNYFKPNYCIKFAYNSLSKYRKNFGMHVKILWGRFNLKNCVGSLFLKNIYKNKLFL